ncbi:hypothetical protein ACYQR9_15625 [Methylobacterium sp. CM6241]
MAKDIKPTFGPRLNLPGQTDMIPLLDNVLLAQQAEAEAARHAIGGNGPPDEPTAPDQGIEPVPPVEPEAVDPAALLPELEPSYANLNRMYSDVLGPRWHVHARERLGLGDERTFRRWRDGEGAPGREEMGKARDHLLTLAINALTAIGEAKLASPLVDLQAGRRSAAHERALEIHAKNMAVADAKKAVTAAKKAAAAAKEEARLARFEAWWKTDCARRAKVYAETMANPRFFVSLAKPPKAAPEAVSLAKPPRVAENA